jgi:hypothetical protein
MVLATIDLKAFLKKRLIKSVEKCAMNACAYVEAIAAGHNVLPRLDAGCGGSVSTASLAATSAHASCGLQK